MKKCAFIRSDSKGTKKCPFGLPITLACLNAGDSVTHMCPVSSISEDKIESVIKANKRVYIYHKTGGRCLYAADVMEKLDSVNCDFGDTAAGMHSPAFSGSPLYAQTFAGVGLDGLYAFPLGFYADNNSSRNLFQGLFSLVGHFDMEIIKNGIVNNPNMKEILLKLEEGDELNTDETLDLENALTECRRKYEDARTDSAKADELARKWCPKT